MLSPGSVQNVSKIFYKWIGAPMTDSIKITEPDEDLKCPDCRHPLKRRRGRQADDCEMLCGGCGRAFDVCDLDTLEEIKKQS
jgi:hypothetical protein